MLDLNHRRETKTPSELTNGTLTWDAAAGRLYELSLNSANTLAEWEAAALSTITQNTAYPLKQQTILPPAKAIRVVVQAEDYTGQGGGGVGISTTKKGMDGTAFYGWDNRDHWLEYAVDIPADGAYALSMRVCMEEPAERALLVDGAYPDGVFRSFSLAPTGGFSNGTNDWDDRKLPKLLHLRKGRHVLRFINLSKPTNLDWISLHAPGEPSRR